MVNLQWSMLNEMKQFISFVIKEARHILRDKRTMLILFGMPVVMAKPKRSIITTGIPKSINIVRMSRRICLASLITNAINCFIRLIA